MRRHKSNGDWCQECGRHRSLTQCGSGTTFDNVMYCSIACKNHCEYRERYRINCDVKEALHQIGFTSHHIDEAFKRARQTHISERDMDEVQIVFPHNLPYWLDHINTRSPNAQANVVDRSADNAQDQAKDDRINKAYDNHKWTKSELKQAWKKEISAWGNKLDIRPSTIENAGLGLFAVYPVATVSTSSTSSRSGQSNMGVGNAKGNVNIESDGQRKKPYAGKGKMKSSSENQFKMKGKGTRQDVVNHGQALSRSTKGRMTHVNMDNKAKGTKKTNRHVTCTSMDSHSVQPRRKHVVFKAGMAVRTPFSSPFVIPLSCAL